jgi:hypothetical protein
MVLPGATAGVVSAVMRTGGLGHDVLVGTNSAVEGRLSGDLIDEVNTGIGDTFEGVPVDKMLNRPAGNASCSQ